MPVADIEVYTFREGLLSSVGHDLKLRATGVRFEVDESAPAVRVWVDPSSLRVVCAMREGREAPGLLSEADKADIERHVRRDVLEAERHPDIRFDSTLIQGKQVTGLLTLHGVTRELRFNWWEEEGARVAELRLDQREWGIRPYRALMGALKLQPEVRIRIRLVL
jgi:polyisoprenoid-binding protein YceI